MSLQCNVVGYTSVLLQSLVALCIRIQFFSFRVDNFFVREKSLKFSFRLYYEPDLINGYGDGELVPGKGGDSLLWVSRTSRLTAFAWLTA